MTTVASPSNGGTVSPAGTKSYPGGTTVAIKATAATGYQFGGWSGACSGLSSCSVKISKTTSVTALFMPVLYNLNVTYSGSGSVSRSTSSSGYLYGTKITLTATPATGYVFSGWSGVCSGSTTTCTVTMTGNMAANAVFIAVPKPDKPTLNSPTAGATNVAMTQVPFSWSVNNATAAKVDNYRIVISQNQGFTGFTDNNGNSSCDNTNTCLTTTTGKTTSYLKDKMELAGWTYYWKVRANGAAGAVWSDVRSFTTVGTSNSNNLIFPFSQGQNWKICQGYNTNQITHKGSLIHSFDLSIASNSAIGSYGCNSSTSATSSKQNVVAPAKGYVRWKGSNSTDIVCMTLSKTTVNGANSVMLGHLTLNSNIAVGVNAPSISQGSIIGTLNSPAALNGNYAHIHMSSYPSVDCSGTSIPFGKAFGGNYNFTSNGSIYQWYGSSVSR